MKQQHEEIIKIMEENGATEEEIEEFKRNEIIVKSVQLVKEHAQHLEERRTSPERFKYAESKVNTINPYAKLLSSSKHHPTISSESLGQQKSPQKARGDSPQRQRGEPWAFSPSKTFSPSKSPTKYTERNA
jgi:hypothetical protein